MKHFLLATCGSAYAQTVLQIGAQLAYRAGASVTILSVSKTLPESIMEMETAYPSPPNRQMPRESPLVRTRTRVGHPAQQIIMELRNGEYDMVIVGQDPLRSPLSRLMDGSIAMQVAERSEVPVLIAKGPSSRIQRILLCDSGIEVPSLLSRFLQMRRIFHDAEVTVLHVMSQISAAPGINGAQLRASAADVMQAHTPEGEILAGDLDVLREMGVKARAELRHGLVVDEILSEAKQGAYQLIVIGAHRGKGWQRYLLDDLGSKIIAQSERSVLVLR